MIAEEPLIDSDGTPMAFRGQHEPMEPFLWL